MRVRSIPQFLIWSSVALGIAASFVDRLHPTLGRAMWAVALTLGIVAVATALPRRYMALVAVISVAAVVSLTYFIQLPRWLHTALALTVAAVWVLMFIVVPLAFRVHDGWRRRDSRSG